MHAQNRICGPRLIETSEPHSTSCTACLAHGRAVNRLLEVQRQLAQALQEEKAAREAMNVVHDELMMMPPEIVGHILSLALENTEQTRMSSLYDLACVSRAWRHAVISTPTLWTRLRVKYDFELPLETQLDIVSVWVARAKSLPIHLMLSTLNISASINRSTNPSNGDISDRDKFATFLQEYAPKLASLDLCIPFSKFTCISDISAANILELKLTDPSRGGGVPSTLDLTKLTPRLRTLRLSETKEYFIVCTNTLSYLEMSRCTSVACADLLRQAKCLKTCKFVDIQGLRHTREARSSPLSTHDSLEELELSISYHSGYFSNDSSIWSQFSFPRLRKLTVNSQEIGRLSIYFQSHGCHIQELHLPGSYTQMTHLKGLLSNLSSSLKRLSFHNDHGQPCIPIFTELFGEFPGCEALDVNNNLCPLSHLQQLTLSTSWMSTDHESGWSFLASVFRRLPVGSDSKAQFGPFRDLALTLRVEGEKGELDRMQPDLHSADFIQEARTDGCKIVVKVRQYGKLSKLF